MNVAPAVQFARRDGVELIRTGSWQISTGRWDVDRADLAAAVAAMSCPAVRPPILKLGHTDERFNGDGQPALGRVENLRTVDSGHTLIGDFAGLPMWLNDVMASAYPDRSVEGTYGFRCQLGHRHPFALTGVALLGVTPPGVGVLKQIEDVAALYGLAASGIEYGGVRVTAMVPGGASASQDNDRLKEYWTRGEGLRRWRGSRHPWTALFRELRKHMPEETAKRVASEWFHDVFGYWPGEARRSRAAAGDDMPSPEPSLIDTVRLAWNASAPESRWIVEATAEHVIVMDDIDRSLYRVPFTTDGSGVRFGEPERVRSAYVPADGVAASVAVFASREESRPADEVASPYDRGGYLPPGLVVVENNTGQPIPVLAPPAEQPTPAPDEGEPEPPAAEPEQPNNTEEDPVSDLSDIARGLGLPEDADKDSILAAIQEQRTPAEPDPQPTPEPQPEPEPQPQEPTRVTASGPDPAMVQQLALLQQQVENLSAQLAAVNAEKAAAVKASVLDEAQKQWKFTPAQRGMWESNYDKSPEVTTSVLASIAPGTAGPGMVSGHTGPAEPTAAEDTEWEQLSRQLWPAESKGV